MMKIKFKTIIPLLLLIITLNSSLSAGNYSKGYRLYRQKKYVKARELLLKAAETSKSGFSYYFLGEIEKNERNYNKATEYYQLAITKKLPQKFIKLAYWNLVVLTERRGNYPAMVKSLKIFWKRTGDSGAKKKVETLINKLMWTNDKDAIALFKRGIKLKGKRIFNEAETCFKDAIGKDSSFLAPKFELGLIQYKRGNINDALYFFNQIREKIPFYGEVNLLLGEIYFTKEEYSRAAEHFEKALEYGFISKKTEYVIRLKNGTSYFKTRDYENAKTNISQALEIREDAIEPLFLISAIHIKEKKYKDALKTLKILRSLNPNDPEIIFQIGSVYYHTKDSKYVKYFRRLFLIYIKSKNRMPKKYIKAFHILQKKYFHDKNYKGVIHISVNLKEKYYDSEINLLSARSYYYLGNYRMAIKHFNKTSLNDDDNFLLCRSYAKRSMNEKAKEVLQKLYYNDGYFRKALKDKILNKIAKEIQLKMTKKPERNGIQK